MKPRLPGKFLKKYSGLWETGRTWRIGIYATGRDPRDRFKSVLEIPRPLGPIKISYLCLVPDLVLSLKYCQYPGPEPHLTV